MKHNPDKLTEFLDEIESYLTNYADAEYDASSASGIPNREMNLLGSLEKARVELKSKAAREQEGGDAVACEHGIRRPHVCSDCENSVEQDAGYWRKRADHWKSLAERWESIVDDRMLDGETCDATTASDCYFHLAEKLDVPNGGSVVDTVLAMLETHPPQSQGVPEGWHTIIQGAIDELGIIDESEGIAGWHLNGAIASWDESGLPAIRDSLVELLSTPAAPQADEWVKCEDRLPTEGDADIFGNVWCSGLWGSSDRGIAPINWRNVGKGDAGDTHWKPTGLTRPQPPK